MVNVFTGRPALDDDLLSLLNENLKLATAEAIETITSKDVKAFLHVPFTCLCNCVIWFLPLQHACC